jgi:hypothetical protein
MVLVSASWQTLAAPKTLAEFPFEFRNGLVWVRVHVEHSVEPLAFLLDSGAGASVVNLRTAKRLGLKLGQRVEVRGVGGATDGLWPQHMTAKAGDVALPQKYLAVDLAGLGRACECGVDGLIGADFFRGRIVQIDFGARKIRLLSSSDVNGSASVVDLKVNRGALLAGVAINGDKPRWLRVDTGCASAVQWVARGAKSEASKTCISVGLAELNIPTTTTSVTLGEMTLDSVSTGLHRRPIFPDEFGLLGSGLLSRFERVTIDTKAGRLVFEGSRKDS